MTHPASALAPFSQATQVWFAETFGTATPAQAAAWPAVASGEHTLLLAPTGSGKTLAAFLAAIDRLMFAASPTTQNCRLVYLSPIKALAFDVERNLRAPLSGIARVADRLGLPRHPVQVAVRTGDTPANERAQFSRRGADILITTPESLYLLLTSQAQQRLTQVQTVIIDEVHALAGQKRGTHLLLTLERLEALRTGDSFQRVGLSATQTPLQTIAEWLGGFSVEGSAARPRPVTIANAQERRALDLTIEVPVEDMQALGETETPLRAPDLDRPDQEYDSEDMLAAPPSPRSMWASIHPRLLELVRAHRSTMVFVNNRRLAERLAAALNELAQEPIARAHHGSVAREQRLEIEDALKKGDLPCIIATSSLELGLDIGSVELVVQIEAPPSVSSGIQRVGRANHQVGMRPKGSIFPKHRGDLVACTEAATRMLAGTVEPTSYPRNCLDVLAQQCVAIVASGQARTVDALYALVRGAAPYATLTRDQLGSVLDMLSGRYPSDEFAELRPRLTWDRGQGTLIARKGAQRLAIANAGVIPDRGLYGVFLAGDDKQSRRVGELDEEMVFEAREGEIFALGASSWRIEEITHDRVLVSPAPGQTGKMPFWRGAGPGRSAELGLGIGALLRKLQQRTDAEAKSMLCSAEYQLDERAADNLIRYIREQSEPPYALPTDDKLVVETFLDEVGDYRVCLLSARGSRVHAPLALSMMEKARASLGVEVEAVWMDDGIVLRYPENDEAPNIRQLLPTAEELEDLVTRSLGESPLFASHFRECAGRALLLPRRNLQRRTPLWAQRKRAAQLLSVSARYPNFPIMLETYRECLSDVFDVAALTQLLTAIAQHRVQVVDCHTDRPSPFSSTLLFNYVGNFIYDADAPLAERRAAALTIDIGQLRELLGQADLKDLIDAESIAAVERTIGRYIYPPQHADDLHDLLLFVGDLSESELFERIGAQAVELQQELVRTRRAISVRIAGERRLIAAEDAARYRDGVGVMPPAGLPSEFLEAVQRPLADIVSRYARTRGPFTVAALCSRYALPEAEVQQLLDAWVESGRLLRGELHPHIAGTSYCDLDVMRAIKRKALAQLRSEIEAVPGEVFARFLLQLHGITRGSSIQDGLFRALEQLEGVPLGLQDLERDMLPARLSHFTAADLDQLLASGEIVWRGLGQHADGGRIALYFREHAELLYPVLEPASGHLVPEVRQALEQRGAVFFSELCQRVSGFPPDILKALWSLVWAGEVTNDTLMPLRSLSRPQRSEKPRRGLRPNRASLPGSEGRWTLLSPPAANETERRAALVHTLLTRHGVLVRAGLKYEGVPGGFSAIYEVLKAMEDNGQVRRGYFVEGLGAAQFAANGVEEILRGQRTAPDRRDTRTFVLAATDPASPWGATLPFPPTQGPRPSRSLGACLAVQNDGTPLYWVSKTGANLSLFVDLQQDMAATWAAEIASSLIQRAVRRRSGCLVVSVDGVDVAASPLAPALLAAGFRGTSRGFLWRKASHGPSNTV